MYVHPNMNMTMIRPLAGLRQVEHLKDFEDIYKRLEDCREPDLVDQERWKGDNIYLWGGDQIVVPGDRVLALLQWTDESSGQVAADRTLKLFKKWFHNAWSDDQLLKTL